MTELYKLGFNNYFQNEFLKYDGQGYIPARIIIQNKTNYDLLCELGELTGELSGKFYFENEENKNSFPVVGDWVIIRPYPEDKKALIDKVLPRKSKFSRKSAGITTEEQLLASNVDVIFLLSSVNADFNTRRLDRYLTLIRDNNIKPVLLLTKSDLDHDRYEILNKLNVISKITDVYFISSFTGEGIEGIKKYFQNNATIALMGSSGVGKTSLINVLIPGIDLKVVDIGDYKDKGKHTTTRREMYLLPDGGIIIDNPGIREIQLWEGSEGLSEAFPDVEAYFGLCKFSDCKHDSEPGCAIKDAIKKGELQQERFKSYLKLQREIEHFQSKYDMKASQYEKKKWKKLTSQAKEIVKFKYNKNK